MNYVYLIAHFLFISRS